MTRGTAGCEVAAKWPIIPVYPREPGMPPGHYPLQWDAVHPEGGRRGTMEGRNSANVYRVDVFVYACVIKSVRLTAAFGER